MSAAAFRGAGFCSGPKLLLKWSFLNYLKGLYEVVPPVASGSPTGVCLVLVFWRRKCLHRCILI